MLQIATETDVRHLRRRNGYLGASGQKSDPTIRAGDLDFV